MKENTRTPGLDPVKRIHTGTEEGGGSISAPDLPWPSTSGMSPSAGPQREHGVWQLKEELEEQFQNVTRAQGEGSPVLHLLSPSMDTSGCWPPSRTLRAAKHDDGSWIGLFFIYTISRLSTREANELSRYLLGTSANSPLAAHPSVFWTGPGKGQVGWSSRHWGRYRATMPGM